MRWLTRENLAYVHPGLELHRVCLREQGYRVCPEEGSMASLSEASYLTSSSSHHSASFTPPTYVLTYEAKQFLYYLTNDLPPSLLYIRM